MWREEMQSDVDERGDEKIEKENEHVSKLARAEELNSGGPDLMLQLSYLDERGEGIDEPPFIGYGDDERQRFCWSVGHVPDTTPRIS